MHTIHLNAVNRLILHKQHLTDDTRIDDIVQVAKDIGGLHATDPTTPYLSLYARARNFTKEHLDAELHIKRNLAKIRCVRNTLYILPGDMIPVAFAATERMVAKNSRGFAEFRGVSPQEYERASRSIMDVLRGREMSVFEIKKALNTHLNVPAILNLMCDQGVLIRGRREKGWDDPYSGVADTSCWLNRQSLLELVHDIGYSHVNAVWDHPVTGLPRIILVAKR